MIKYRSRISIAIVILICIAVILILKNPNNIYSNILVGFIASIIVSIIVSIYYQEELLKLGIKFDQSGLEEYISDFELIQEEIRSAIKNGKDVDIYVMYASSFFNMATSALKSILSKKSSTLRVFIYSQENPFIDSYTNHWKYTTSDEVKTKIKNVINLLNTIYNDIDANQRGIFELYEIKSAPISASFYRIDDQLYFVPNKLVTDKNIKPFVFKLRRTSENDCIYNKITGELNTLIKNQEVEKL